MSESIIILFYLHLRLHNVNYYLQMDFFKGYIMFFFIGVLYDSCVYTSVVFDGQVDYKLGKEDIRCVSIGEM